MLDFVQSILVAINLVLTLAFLVLLVLLCIRARSMGLIIITAVLIFRLTVGLIPNYVFRLYIDQWVSGELNNWLTPHMTIGEFVILYNLVTRVLHGGLLVLGAFLIYQEWRSGKIPWRRYKPLEVVNHA